jgi:ATP-binding cassette subfamily F protein 3
MGARQAEHIPKVPGSAAPTSPSNESAPPAVRLLKKKPSAEVKALRKRLEDVEKKIHALERRIEEIGAMLADPKLYANGDRVRSITGERRDAEQEIAGLMHEWEELSTALAAHE